MVLRVTTSQAEQAFWVTMVSLAFGIANFVGAPVLGALSDRYGRRPVLLISMTVMALDYAIMGLAASVWVLLVARAVSGITAATHSTANAFIADISTPDQRAKRFGLIGAAFGVGFVLGPIAGGLLAGIDSRAPFWAAAALAKLHARIVEEAPFVWIAHDVGPRAIAAKVKGVVQPRSWFIDIAPMSVD